MRHGLLLLGLYLLVALPSVAEEMTAESEIRGYAARILPLEARVIDIVGDFSGVEGKTTGMEVKETPTELRIELSGDILFDFDKWDIRPAAEPTLRQVADLIAKRTGATVSIAGYTDSKGDDNYNLRLSEKRADSVKNWLLQHQSALKTINTKGFGEANPVAANANPDGSDNPEGRQKNRRVEITVKKG